MRITLGGGYSTDHVTAGEKIHLGHERVNALTAWNKHAIDCVGTAFAASTPRVAGGIVHDVFRKHDLS